MLCFIGVHIVSCVAIPPPSAYRSSPVQALQRGAAPPHHPHVHSLVPDVTSNSKPLQNNSQASLSAPRPMHAVSYERLCCSSTTSGSNCKSFLPSIHCGVELHVEWSVWFTFPANIPRKLPVHVVVFIMRCLG